jgi:orotate phosphoribosyltransferase-like protein
MACGPCYNDGSATSRHPAPTMTSLIHQVAKLDLDGSSPEEIAAELDIHLQMVAWLQLNDGYKLVKEAVCAAQA